METSTSRFVEITDKKLIEFVVEQENPNAKRKTAYNVELCEVVESSDESMFRFTCYC